MTLNSVLSITYGADGNLYFAENQPGTYIRKVVSGIFYDAGFPASSGTVQDIAAFGNGILRAELSGCRVCYHEGDAGCVVMAGIVGQCGNSESGLAATATKLEQPIGLAAHPTNPSVFYVSDAYNHNVRKYDDGVMTIIAGTGAGNSGEGGFSGDGGPGASAQLNSPRGIAADSSGNVYIADTFNYRIRKITAATGIITTVAGKGEGATASENGVALGNVLGFPHSVAVDAAGSNLYISEMFNSWIRQVNLPTGRISKLAGYPRAQSGFSGDWGDPKYAKLNFPFKVVVAPDGNVVFVDANNGVIRKIRFLGQP